MWASLVYFCVLLTKLWGIMCFSLVSMLDFMGQNLIPLKSRLSKLQSWHQNFSCLVGPNEHFYTRCLLSARTSHGTTFAPRLYWFISLVILVNKGDFSHPVSTPFPPPLVCVPLDTVFNQILWWNNVSGWVKVCSERGFQKKIEDRMNLD